MKHPVWKIASIAGHHGQGFTIAELLIALVLMSLVLLSISNFVIKGSLTSQSLNNKDRQTPEIQALISDLQIDLAKGAYISDNSYTDRLEYTIPDSSGNALKKIYKIDSSTGTKYLRLSLDGGSTWISPYKVSSYTKYSLTGTPRFLYAGISNNCTVFTDSNANLVYQPGTDSAGSTTTCPFSSGGALARPSHASKIDLNGFVFSTQSGSPAGTRTLPTDVMIAVAPDLVRSTVTPLPSPAVKDPMLIQSFVTNTTTMTYGTSSFNPGTAFWDAARKRLIVGGYGAKIFVMDRDGVIIGSPISVGASISTPLVALESDGRTLLVVDDQSDHTNYLYRYDLTGTSPLTPTTSLNLTSYFGSAANAMAYDPNTPNDVYLVGLAPSTSSPLKIYERNKTTLALVSSWDLPAAFNYSTAPAEGFFIEPFTGDFVLARDSVNGSGTSRNIDIYRITRAGVSTSFSINIADLGSSTTGYWNGCFRISYDPQTNRMFLVDWNMRTVYEIALDRLISARS